MHAVTLCKWAKTCSFLFFFLSCSDSSLNRNEPQRCITLQHTANENEISAHRHELKLQHHSANTSNPGATLPQEDTSRNAATQCNTLQMSSEISVHSHEPKMLRDSADKLSPVATLPQKDTSCNAATHCKWRAKFLRHKTKMLYHSANKSNPVATFPQAVWFVCRVM